MTADRVLLAHMPMGLAQVPNLALSLLKPALQRAGVTCDVRYFNIDLLDRFVHGPDDLRRYVRLVEQQDLSEACAAQFAATKYGPDPERDALVQGVLRAASEDNQDLFARIAAAVEPFLVYCLESVDWSRYKIVGFTSLFVGMTVPSAILAGRLKERFPDLITLLGGWNTGGAMGEVIAEKFDAFDYVLRGEADESFVAFARAVLEDRPVNDIAGIVYRDRTSGRLHSVPQAVVARLDDVPMPDFDDWFSALARSRFAGQARRGPSLPFESSRGCWWGEISHCKFCGLNGLSMAFRSKSPARVLAEVDHIVERYSPELLFATDTILDNRYFKDLLPEMRRRHPETRLAYEIKAPVRYEQMRLLADARIEQITVGIESLSTRILKLMGKGASVLQNVHCMRLAAEMGVQVGWQYLYGFPEETLPDYEQVVDVVPHLVHLDPPEQACRVTIARFSPYFDKARENHVSRLRAHRLYRASYPWTEDELMRLAYHFEFEHADGRPADVDARIHALLTEAVARWREAHASARLDLYRSASIAAVVDTRQSPPAIFLFRGASRALYEQLGDVTSEARLARLALDLPPDLEVLIDVIDARDVALLAAMEQESAALGAPIYDVPSPFDLAAPRDEVVLRGALRAWLDELGSVGLVLSEGERHVALAVPRARPGDPPAQARPDSVRPGLRPAALNILPAGTSS